MSLASSCSCLCPVQWSQVLSWEWRCSRSSADRRCSNYIWVIDHFISYQSASYIRDLMVYIYLYTGLALYWLKYLMKIVTNFPYSFNSLWPSDAIRRQRSGSPMAQVMACCLTAPSHYLNQCWLILTKVQWCLSKGNFAWDITAMSH